MCMSARHLLSGFPMKIVITGGAGFLGQKLARSLMARGEMATGEDGARKAIREIVLVDQVAGPDLGDARVKSVVADIADPAAMRTLITPDVDLIFHLAAIVSGGGGS